MGRRNCIAPEGCGSSKACQYPHVICSRGNGSGAHITGSQRPFRSAGTFATGTIVLRTAPTREFSAVDGVGLRQALRCPRRSAESTAVVREYFETVGSNG